MADKLLTVKSGKGKELCDLLRKERKNWVISTKVGEEFEANTFSDEGVSRFDFSPKHTRMSVERSMRRLRTDYLDLVMIHSNGNDRDILLNSGCQLISRMHRVNTVTQYFVGHFAFDHVKANYLTSFTR